MISADYVRMMARYNAWQNDQLTDFVLALPNGEAMRDRGAFFGSILGTLSHLYWGDWIWMSRFDGGSAPDLVPQPGGGLPDTTTLFPTAAAWSADRFRMDGRIRAWARGLHDVDLTGDLSWYSGASGRDMRMAMGQVVVQLFNHQTHHRGQVHAMLTAAGSKAPVSDIAFMPESAA